MIAYGGGLVAGIVFWATILLGVGGVLAYVLSGRIARFAKRRQMLVRTVVWSTFFPMVSCLSFVMFLVFLGGIAWASLDNIRFFMRLFFWFPDPSLFFLLPLIPLGIWLLGIVLIARKDLAQAVRRKW